MKGNPNNFIMLANEAISKMSIPIQYWPVVQRHACTEGQLLPKQQTYETAGIVSAGTLAAKRYIQNFRNKVFVIGIPRELGRSS